MYKESEDGEVVTHVSKVEARAGSKTHANRNILVVSLALVVVLLVIAVAFGFFETDKTGADQVNTDNASQATAK
jgi:hypothetical protein